MLKSSVSRLCIAISVTVAIGSTILHAQEPAETAEPIEVVGDAISGEFVFDDKCSSCHLGNFSTDSGPSLIGVVGRKAAAVEDYTYTPALTASGITWDAASLDKFLTNPKEYVEGTDMKRVVADPADRADVIAYLASLK